MYKYVCKHLEKHIIRHIANPAKASLMVPGPKISVEHLDIQLNTIQHFIIVSSKCSPNLSRP